MDERFAYNELVFDGKVAEVHKVGLRMSDGNVVQRDLIHYDGAAVILPVLADGSIVLIRNYRFTVDEHLWELPAGMLEEDEDPAACATRELTEETGYTAGKIEKLGEFFTGPGTTDELMHAYLATDLIDGEQNLERYEEITVEVFPDAKVRRMVVDGTIHDAKTVTALAIYWLRENA
ncbi:MAG: NUDIX hydrolase [Planctomycetota bacterium]|jgi:ADP-ribose pyrophosphatase